MWTKEEIRTVKNLWETHNTEAIAEIIGRPPSQVSSMAGRLRKAGAHLPKKWRKGSVELLLREVLEER